MAICKTTAP
jgi:hypothetical protein